MSDEKKTKAARGGESAPGKGKAKDGDKGKAKAKSAKPAPGLPAAKVPRVPKEKVNPRIRERYRTQAVEALTKEFGYTNPMQVPRLVKVVLNMGLGEATQNVKVIDSAVAEMTAISGQKPLVAKARLSISTFKLRAGSPIGVSVTLRRERMWEFLDRFVTLALPRTRDFKGISPKQFDGKGNFSMGVKEQLIFPEIDYDKIDKVKGLNVTVCTTARTDREGRALLVALGFPFRS